MSEHRLLTFPQLRSLKGIAFSRQHINELVRAGTFPKAVKSPGGHVNFWVESEVDAYILRLVEARDTAPPDAAMAGRVAKMLAGRKRKSGTVTIQRRKPRAAANPR